MGTHFLHLVKSITALIFWFGFIYCIYLFCKHKYLQMYSDATSFINTRLYTSLPKEDYHGASWFRNKRYIFWYAPPYTANRIWTSKGRGRFPSRNSEHRSCLAYRDNLWDDNTLNNKILLNCPLQISFFHVHWRPVPWSTAVKSLNELNEFFEN